MRAGPGPRSRGHSSPGVGFVPGRFYDLEVEIDRVTRRVSVSVDGERRFALEGRFVPVSSRHVWPARGPRGSGARNIGYFSGTMIPEDMWVAGPPGLESLPLIAVEPAILTDLRTPPWPGRRRAGSGRWPTERARSSPLASSGGGCRSGLSPPSCWSAAPRTW